MQINWSVALVATGINRPGCHNLSVLSVVCHMNNDTKRRL